MYEISKIGKCLEIVKSVLFKFEIFAIIGSPILMNCVLFKWPRVCSV